MTNGSNSWVNKEKPVFTLADVLEALTGLRPVTDTPIIHQVSANSLEIQSGALYVALPGKDSGGHVHVGDAFHRGARVALVQHDLSPLFPVIDLRNGVLPDPLVIPDVPFCLRVAETRQALGKVALSWRQNQQLHLIAIIGSVQRSTTRELITEILNQRYRTHLIHSGDEPEIDFPLSLLKMSGKRDRAIIELDPTSLSSPALLDLVQPDIAAVTDAGPIHYEANQSQASITRSAITLLQALHSAPHCIVLLNADEPHINTLTLNATNPVFSYGLSPQADLWADEIESQGVEGIRFRIHSHDESLYLRVPLLGHYSVHTALLASAIGLIEGLSWHDIATGLQVNRPQLRLVTIDSSNGAILLDDTYSASSESTLAALTLLEGMDGRKVAVLGQVEGTEPYKPGRNKIVGVRAAEVVQELVAVGEEAQPIVEGASQAGLAARAITWVKTTQDAVEHLRQILNDGDIVLVKGPQQDFMEHIVSALAVGQ